MPKARHQPGSSEQRYSVQLDVGEVHRRGRRGIGRLIQHDGDQAVGAGRGRLQGTRVTADDHVGGVGRGGGFGSNREVSHGHQDDEGVSQRSRPEAPDLGY